MLQRCGQPEEVQTPQLLNRSRERAYTFKTQRFRYFYRFCMRFLHILYFSVIFRQNLKFSVYVKMLTPFQSPIS